MTFATYRVGRSKDADVYLEDSSISRRQVEVTVTPDLRYYVVDCHGTAGTYVRKGDSWELFQQGYLLPDADIAFGDLKLRLADIIKRLPKSPRVDDPVISDPVSVRPVRKIDTGEVVLLNSEGHE